MATKRSRPSKPPASEPTPSSPSGEKKAAASRSAKGSAKKGATRSASGGTTGSRKATAGGGKSSARADTSGKAPGRAAATPGGTPRPAEPAAKDAAAKTRGKAGAARAKTPGRAAQPPPRRPEVPEDETFEDVPVEPVRRRRRTVPTATGRRRIKTHRPAPHASAPGPKPRSGEDAIAEDVDTVDEASGLAQLPTQTARGEKTREGRTLPIEIDPERIEQSLRKLAGDLSQWARRGRYTKVRFRFRGKPLLPDLPLAAVVAAEGLTFYWGGILRALLMNVAGGSLLDVELIHDAEKEIQAGKEALLSGELDRALDHYRRAVAMQPEGAQAHLNLGIALKLRGEREEATTALNRALELDPDGAVGAEAKRLLERL